MGYYYRENEDGTVDYWDDYNEEWVEWEKPDNVQVKFVPKKKKQKAKKTNIGIDVDAYNKEHGGNIVLKCTECMDAKTRVTYAGTVFGAADNSVTVDYQPNGSMVFCECDCKHKTRTMQFGTSDNMINSCVQALYQHDVAWQFTEMVLTAAEPKLLDAYNIHAREYVRRLTQTDLRYSIKMTTDQAKRYPQCSKYFDILYPRPDEPQGYEKYGWKGFANWRDPVKRQWAKFDYEWNRTTWRDAWKQLTYANIYYFVSAGAFVVSFGGWTAVSMLVNFVVNHFGWTPWILAVWYGARSLVHFAGLSVGWDRYKKTQAKGLDQFVLVVNLILGVMCLKWFISTLARIFKGKPKEEDVENQGFKFYKGAAIMSKGIIMLGMRLYGVVGRVKITDKQHKAIKEIFDDFISMITGFGFMYEDDFDYGFGDDDFVQNQGFENVVAEIVEIESGKHEDLTVKASDEDFKKQCVDFLQKYKWIITGVVFAIFVVLLLIRFFRKREQEVVNEGKGNKHRKEKNRDYDPDGPKDILRKENNNSKQEDYRAAARDRKLQYDDERERKNEFNASLARVISSATGRFGTWDRMNRQLTISGSMEPEKLMSYDTIMVRMGPFETKFSTKDRHSLLNVMSKLMKTSRQFQIPVLVSTDNEQSWRRLDRQEKVSNEAEQFLDAAYFQKKAALVKQQLTEIEISQILKAKNKLAEYGKIMLDKMVNVKEAVITNEVLAPINEGLMGMKHFNIEKMARSIVMLHNSDYGTNFAGFTLGEYVATVAHGVYDIKMEQQTIGKISTQGQESTMQDLIVKDVCKDGDWALLSKPDPQPPLSPVNDKDYEGPAFMIIPKAVGIPDIAFGVAVVAKNMCWHYIPTTGGNSGLPIYDMTGKIIAMHKGFSGIANVGVPIRNILEKQRGKLFDLKIVNQGVIDFSYLPRSMVPRIDFSDTDVVIPELGPEHQVIGSVKYSWKDYGKHHVTPLYNENYEEFELPNPYSVGWDVAIPTIHTIQKDFAKYTVPVPLGVEMDRFYKALELFKQHLVKRLPYGLHLCPRDKVFEQVNRQASTGYPVKTKCGVKGDFIEKYMDTVHVFLDMIERGDNPTVMFDELGKEELRDVERLLLEKVRSFNSGGVHLYAAERVVFGELCDIFKKQPFFKTHTTLGWSPYYGNWDQLVNYMTSLDAPTYSNIDFAKWDSRFSPLMFEGILDVLINFFSPDEIGTAKLYMDWWFWNVVQNGICVLPFNEEKAYLVVVYRGMKSGCLVTFIFNCFGNEIRHIYCIITPDYTKTFDEFEADNTWMSCGDDFTFQNEEVDIIEYGERSADWGWLLEEYHVECIVKGKGNFVFAGCETRWIGRHAVPYGDVGRFLFNVAVVKKGMSLPQYCQKLDNLIRVMCVSDITSVIKVLKFRDFLVKTFIDVPGMAITCQGFCSILDAIKMHDYVYEAWPIISIEPHKSGKLPTFVNEALLTDETEFKYHGNYCGPGWSGGKYQNSVTSELEAVDDLDEACREHDRAYAEGEDLEEADFKLAKRAWKDDKILSSVIYLQGLYRKLKGEMTRAKKRGATKAVFRVKRELKAVKRELGRKKFSARGGRGPRGGGRKFKPRGGGGMPARYGKNTLGKPMKARASGKNSVFATGQDLIGVLNTGSGFSAGDTMQTFGLNQTSWPTARLACYFQMFEKWEIKSVTIHYEPAVGTNQSGSICLGVDPDPSDPFTQTGVNAIQKLMSSNKARMIQVAKPGSVVFKPEKKQTDMYTSYEDSERFSSYGNVFVLAGVDLPANLSLGNLMLSYNIRFYQPLLEEASDSSSQTSHIATLTLPQYICPVTDISNSVGTCVQMYNNTDPTILFDTWTSGSGSDWFYNVKLYKAGIYFFAMSWDIQGDDYETFDDDLGYQYPTYTYGCVASQETQYQYSNGSQFCNQHSFILYVNDTSVDAHLKYDMGVGITNGWNMSATRIMRCVIQATLTGGIGKKEQLKLEKLEKEKLQDEVKTLVKKEQKFLERFDQMESLINSLRKTGISEDKSDGELTPVKRARNVVK